MFERRMKAYVEMAESLDDEVGMVMLWPVYTNEEMRGGDDMFFVKQNHESIGQLERQKNFLKAL